MNSQKYIIHSFVLFLLSLSVFCAEEFSPAGKVWIKDAADYPEIRMVFHKNGKLEFQKGFLWFNPGQWQYLSKTKELVIIFPNAKEKDFKGLIRDQKNPNSLADGNPKSVDFKNKEVKYDFPNKINFNGFVFYESKEKP